MLKSTESFFSKINLHILQCDADIQEDVKITSQEEFDAYIKTMTIKGLGELTSGLCSPMRTSCGGGRSSRISRA